MHLAKLEIFRKTIAQSRVSTFFQKKSKNITILSTYPTLRVEGCCSLDVGSREAIGTRIICRFQELGMLLFLKKIIKDDINHIS